TGRNPLNHSLENISKEEIEQLCLEIKPKSEFELVGERDEFYTSWYDYLGYKTSKIKKRLQELIPLYNIFEIDLLELLTEIDTELTNYLELEGKNWDNHNLSDRHAPIYRLTQLVQQLYQYFDERYYEHGKEYRQQKVLK
ncbi:MAG: hypothetical protein ACK4TA_25680, partial [Saprospiraceae bacterium]